MEQNQKYKIVSMRFKIDDYNMIMAEAEQLGETTIQGYLNLLREQSSKQFKGLEVIFNKAAVIKLKQIKSEINHIGLTIDYIGLTQGEFPELLKIQDRIRTIENIVSGRYGGSNQ